MPKTPEEIKARQAAWWKANRAKASEYRKSWRRKNPERAKEIDHALKKKHAVRMLEYSRAYNAKNRELKKEKLRRWKLANPERAAQHVKDSHARHPEIAVNAKARYRARIGTDRLSKGLTAKLMISQAGLCNICKQPFPGTPHRDHIIPVSRGGRNVDENIQLLCRRCNISKSDKLPGELRRPCYIGPDSSKT